MRKQVLIVGLGQFGMALARALTDRNVEVLAVDRREELVQTAAAFAAEAVCFDATDEAALAGIAPARRDVCVCAIGDESRESSIICTALLRKMGAKRLIGRANEALHERILELVGAHEVVNPEREFGERFASRIVYENVLAEMPLGADLVITELEAPDAFAGRSLADLDLPRRHGITVVAIRRTERGSVALPRADEIVVSGDILVVVAREGVVAELMKRV